MQCMRIEIQTRRRILQYVQFATSLDVRRFVFSAVHIRPHYMCTLNTSVTFKKRDDSAYNSDHRDDYTRTLKYH